MKRICSLFILLVVLFIPFMVSAKSCDTSKVTIEDVSLNSKADNVEELEQASINNKKINLNLKMSEVGDYIVYDVKIKNDSEDDFLVDNDSFIFNSDIMEYSILSDNKIVKSGEERLIQLKVIYKVEVDAEKFQNGKYVDKQDITLSLSNNSSDNNISNPKTNNNWLLIALTIILIIQIILYFLHEKNINKHSIMILIISLMLVPSITYALCKVDIQVSSQVEIEKIELNKFYLEDYWDNNKTEYSFEEGMTWRDWLDSDYNTNNISFVENINVCAEVYGFFLLKEQDESVDKVSALYNDLIENNKTYYYGQTSNCPT